MRLTWSTAVGYIFFMVCAGVATQVYKVGGENANILFFWLAALGLTGSGFYSYFQAKWYERQSKKEAEKQAGGNGGGGSAAAAAASGEAAPGDVDLLTKDAEAKLIAAKLAEGGLSEVPVIFVLGDAGSTKTTVMVHSGLEPELLSGQVYQQDNMIVTTRAANFWYAKRAVFAEAGGRVWLDNTSWEKLLKKLSPGRLKSVFGGKKSAPRAAILCVDIERFLQPGASDTMATVARAYEMRLNEISKKFGISFPVYVLFTKADRVTFFLDYFRNLSNEEAAQVLGVTLPMRSSRGGVYAEEETQRLSQAFNELFHSLCDKRIEFLPRENDAEKLPGCYEFPREFRKLRSALVQFLVDVGRPSQLAASPFVRGFYFTGVRPVFVADVAPTPMAAQRQSAAMGAASGATQMFQVGMRTPQQGAVPMAAPQQQTGRKMPQWVFLSRLFNNVILEDRAALGASGASTKTSGLQRAMLGLLAISCLVWSVGMTISFFRNRTLENEIIDATRQIKAVRMAAGSTPAIEDLRRLDSLREKLAQLTKWRAEGAPWSYRWGLYVGDDLLRPARRAYYDCFNLLLFSDTQRRMLTFLGGVPEKAKEEDDYGYAYNTLRAHLMTTSKWEKVASTDVQDEPKWLTETLMARWVEKREIDDARRGLAELQFQFYGSDLHNENPFSTRDDAGSVHKARIYLASFSGFERAYNALLAEANRRNPSVNFNKRYPGSSAVVVNNRDVPGAFTKQGWAFMQNAFKNLKRSMGGEEWVLESAKYKSAAAVPENLEQMLRDRYTADYIKTWRQYYSITIIARYSSVRDAADKLKQHSDARAPVLALIGLGSLHTSVDPAEDPYAQRVRKAFQWSNVVVPASPELTYITNNNRPYTSGLSGLQIAVEAAAAKPVPDQSDAQATQMRANDATQNLRQVAAFSSQDLEGKLDQTIIRIMEEPIKAVADLFRPDRALNAGGAALCAQFNVINRKFPFDPKSADDTTLIELNSLLQPGAGRLWQFYDQTLKPYLQKPPGGNRYEPVQGSGVTLNPNFVTFFNQVARLAEAVYRGGPEPRMEYAIQVLGVQFEIDKTQARSAVLTIDGKPAQLNSPPVGYTWTGSPTHNVRFAYNESTVYREKEGQTVWAVFRFFVDSKVETQADKYLLIWPVRGGQGEREIANARFLVDLKGAPAVFDSRFFGGLRCIANVALK